MEDLQGYVLRRTVSNGTRPAESSLYTRNNVFSDSRTPPIAQAGGLAWRVSSPELGFFNSAARLRAASSVASGPPGCSIKTLPSLSTAKIPRIVPFGDFLSPRAAINVAVGLQRRGYGNLCLVLNVVFAFGESAERP
ncbi:hypothetical protein RIB2604_02000070 [Aspergillus luchuensis]|uniref:Uncharacterized protein n=1 Tax=Aspergillus kawachii TaxID=1069201 RepID=A0A146FHD8_ASPKA|nr:hypothetical protein RIB2604_02000070 [Aspergillus luchuensis]